MPGKSSLEVLGDEVLERYEPLVRRSRTKRAKIGGTFTRAKCSLPVFGLRTRTARLSESPEM